MISKSADNKENQETMVPHSALRRKQKMTMTISLLLETTKSELRKSEMPIQAAMMKMPPEEEVDSEVPEFNVVEREVQIEAEEDSSKTQLKELND